MPFKFGKFSGQFGQEPVCFGQTLVYLDMFWSYTYWESSYSDDIVYIGETRLLEESSDLINDTMELYILGEPGQHGQQNRT